MTKKVPLIILVALLVVPSFVHAGSINTMRLNGNEWVVESSGSDKVLETKAGVSDFPDSFTVLNPERNEKAWRWTGDGVEYASTGKTIPPSPSEAIGQITDYFIEVKNDTTAGLNRMENLLNKYPTVSQAIEQEAWGIYRNRIEQAAKNTDINDTESHNLKAISKGTY